MPATTTSTQTPTTKYAPTVARKLRNFEIKWLAAVRKKDGKVARRVSIDARNYASRWGSTAEWQKWDLRSFLADALP